MKNKLFMGLLLCALCIVTMACNQRVPAGYKGRVNTVDGWNKDLLHAGKHQCFGRDKMWLVETRDVTAEEPLDILLQEEKVNFGVTVSAQFTLKSDDSAVLPLFDKVRPSKVMITEGDDNFDKVITLDGVYETYAALVMKSVPRQIIRGYTTEQILLNANAVEQEVQDAIIQALLDTPIDIKRVTLTNMDFPDFITAAQERAKEAEIKIREEENRQKMRIVEATNKKKIAEINYQIALLDAKKISDQNRLIGESLMGEAGNRYLRYHEIKVYGNAADGPNNTILLPMNFAGFGGSESQRINIPYETMMTPIREKISDAMKNDPERSKHMKQLRDRKASIEKND